MILTTHFEQELKAIDAKLTGDRLTPKREKELRALRAETLRKMLNANKWHA